MKKAVVIEKQVCITAFGELEATVQSLFSGMTAIQPSPSYTFPVAHAPFADPTLRDPSNTFALIKKRLALPGVLSDPPLFVFGAAKGDIRALEPAGDRHPSHSSPLLSEQAGMLCRILGIRPVRTIAVSNACASGVVALSVASFYLEKELYSTAVVAGFDMISHFVTSGFHSLGALSETGAKPFDIERDGLTLGDGAACAVLSYRYPEPGDVIIAGFHQTNDANHRTGPSRTGEGLYRAAAGVLEKSGVSPDEVGAVKCHGTATVYNDAMEARAVTTLFSAAAPPCFSVKGAIGHTSGAGSLIETLLAARFLKEKKIPPTAGFSREDPDAIIPVAAESRPVSRPSILCLSAGFGGLNAALLLKEYTDG
jgi:3-oxoacyl-[acyl-carrier-protein] synthase-1